MFNSITGGVAHKMPTDFKKAIVASKDVYKIWEQTITPLGRNEWICWVTSAKLIETRERRIKRAVSDLKSVKRRPCCWAGCIHRK